MLFRSEGVLFGHGVLRQESVLTVMGVPATQTTQTVIQTNQNLCVCAWSGVCVCVCLGLCVCGVVCVGVAGQVCVERVR